MVTFGIGALVITLCLYAIVCAYRIIHTGGIYTEQERAPPPLHWPVLKFAGVSAGICWSLANVCIIEATVLGGNAIVMAQVLSAQIIASGACGLLYYGEGGGNGARGVWVVAALWTLIAMMLLGFEKDV